MTPYQYFSTKRIEIAASLLLNSNLQVKEIAESLNYSDQPYFSNAFKKIMGVSPEKYRKMEIFPCGRLDKNTLGLLILTNNGALAHRLLSPKCHVEKTYRFECERPLTDGDVELLCKGVDIGEKSSTQPAKVTLTSSRSGEISVTEGKFHQIKRMFQAVCNKITYLERIRFADIPLDTNLARGEWRELTDEEREILEKH